MSDDAKITIRADGSQAVTEAGKIRQAMSGAAAATGTAFKTAGGEIKNLLGGIGRDALSAATSLNRVNFDSAIASAVEYKRTTAELAQASGRDVGVVRAQLEYLSNATGEGEQALQRYVKAVGDVTYSYAGAADAAKALGDEALASGRSIEEYKALGHALAEMGADGQDAEKVLANIRAQAQGLGTIGGPKALQDQLASLGDTVQQVDLDTDEAKRKFTALLGVLGAGQRPEQARRTQASVLSTLTGRAREVSRTVGYDILDEQGRVKDPTKVIADLKRDVAARGLSQKQQRQAFRDLFGNVEGSQVFNADIGGQVAKVAALAPKSAAEDAAKVRASEEFKRREAENRAERGKRELGEKAAPWQTRISNLIAEHPVAGTLAATYGGSVGKSLLGAGWNALFGGGGGAAAGGGSGAGAAAGGGGSAATGANLALAAEAAAPAAAGIGIAALQLKAITSLKVDPEEYKREALGGGFGAYGGDTGLRAGRARALIRAAERSGGSLEGFESQAGKPLLAAAEADPALKSVLSQLREGSAQIDAKTLPKEIAAALVEALRGSPLQIQVTDGTSNPVNVTKAAAASGAGRN